MKALRKILFYIWQFTWGLPQNIVGLIGFLVAKAHGREQEKFHNSYISYISRKDFGGVSLGIFIFINTNVRDDRRHDMRIHEYGHTIQSAILGPLWPFVIALPSVIWCNTPYFRKLRKEKNVSYYCAYCEGWSNLCGLWGTKERFITKECLERGRYGKPINPNRNPAKDIKGRKYKKK